METHDSAATRAHSATRVDRLRGRLTAVPLHRELRARGFYPAALSSALCLALLSIRVGWAGGLGLAFMAWNLFLAWLPWWLSVAVDAAGKRRHGVVAFTLCAVWLPLLPNAPYMVTDLLHLQRVSTVPLWFDAALLFAFAWTGCVLGFLSLAVVHGRIEARFGRWTGWLFVCAVAVLTGFGIYLGRFLRWNSWDVVRSPGALLRDVVAPLRDPAAHGRTLAVTFLFAAFFLVAYGTFAGMRRAASR